MKVTVGLDIGGSTTKVVGFNGRTLLKQCFVKASDPIASAYGALGSFLTANQLGLDDIASVRVTGVGSSYIHSDLMTLKTDLVDEFQCVGRGGLHLSGWSEAIVVSMGTGTSIVKADRAGCRHIIGTGVGGGTLVGLARSCLNITEVEGLVRLAKQGTLGNADLTIQDISEGNVTGLDPSVTASNLGKVTDQTERTDLAKGLMNLVFQSVGTASVLAARMENQKRIIFAGSVMRLEEAHQILQPFTQLYDVEILIPDKAEYCTAIGAALR